MKEYELVPILNFCEGCEASYCNDLHCEDSLCLCDLCDIGINNCGNQSENCTEKYKGMPQVFIEVEE